MAGDDLTVVNPGGTADTLVFEHAGTVPVTFAVEGAANGPAERR